MSQPALIQPDAADAFRRAVTTNFEKTARDIVNLVHKSLAGSFQDAQLRALQSLDRKELNAVAEELTRSFMDRKMGLKELTAHARKEVGIIVIRKSVPKYRASLLEGAVGPVEYFDRFYRPHFLACGLPANGISTVDPNLHMYLKKLGQFPQVTKLLHST